MEICSKKINGFFNDLADSLSSLEREDFLTQEGIEKKAFTKTKKIDFQTIILLLFSMAASSQKKSILSTLAGLLLALGKNFAIPSRQAINKAKKFLSIEKLNKIVFNIAHYFPHEHNIKLFDGKKVYMVDGTCSKLPRSKSVIKLFGLRKKNAGHYPLAHIVTFYELGTNVIKNYVFGGKKSSERNMLLEGIGEFEKGSIFVGDCNFYSAAVQYLIEKSGFNYVFRINEQNCYKFIEGLTFKNNSAVTEMTITSEMRSAYKNLKNAPKTIKVRIIKINTDPKTDRELYLVTNIMNLTHLEFGDLYFERQRIEDSIKYKKLYGGLEFIHFNSNKHTILLSIIGIVGYHNMMQLTLSRVSKTPGPQEEKEKVLNRKVGWENTMNYFLDFIKTKQVKENFANLLKMTANTIRINRFAPRYSKQPLNPHLKSSVKKKAKKAFKKRLREEKKRRLAS